MKKEEFIKKNVESFEKYAESMKDLLAQNKKKSIILKELYEDHCNRLYNRYILTFGENHPGKIV